MVAEKAIVLSTKNSECIYCSVRLMSASKYKFWFYTLSYSSVHCLRCDGTDLLWFNCILILSAGGNVTRACSNCGPNCKTRVACSVRWLLVESPWCMLNGCLIMKRKLRSCIDMHASSILTLCVSPTCGSNKYSCVQSINSYYLENFIIREDRL